MPLGGKPAALGLFKALVQGVCHLGGGGESPPKIHDAVRQFCIHLLVYHDIPVADPGGGGTGGPDPPFCATM